ncbi:MAG: elongation factor P [Candidatus Aminicenantes bacterium]|nr:MAG: elongation factor P [Candidatus Aminicenantes bacterium]
MINATQIRKGMVIKVEGELYKVLEATHVTPGKGQALMQTKLRNLKDQTLLDYRFRSKDRVEQAYFEKVEMEFLYESGNEHIFMNLENYEQIKLSSGIIGDSVNYLIPNAVFSIEMHEGRPVGIEPPLTINLKVVKTEPFLKGATQSASSKPAVLETGIAINVPQFIKEGDVIRIDTREDKYLERVKSEG